MKDFDVEGGGRSGFVCVCVSVCRGVFRKYVAGVSASFGHCSLSISDIVRYREAREKREVGIYAEFPVFVVAVGLFFPCCSWSEQQYHILHVWTGDSKQCLEHGFH